MDSKEFEKVCVKFIKDYTNTDNRETITEEDVFVVWSCKTLQNNKALLTTVIADGMYYECTYNGDKDEMYVDAYKKWENIVIDGKDMR